MGYKFFPLFGSKASRILGSSNPRDQKYGFPKIPHQLFPGFFLEQNHAYRPILSIKNIWNVHFQKKTKQKKHLNQFFRYINHFVFYFKLLHPFLPFIYTKSRKYCFLKTPSNSGVKNFKNPRNKNNGFLTFPKPRRRKKAGELKSLPVIM